MKIAFAIICLFLVSPSSTKAAFTETAVKTKTALSIAEQWERFDNVYAVLNFGHKDYEQLMGRKLSLVERISLKLTQHRLKNELKQYEATGVLPQKLFDSYLSPRKSGSASTVLLVVVIVLLLLLLIPLALIGKWN